MYAVTTYQIGDLNGPFYLATDGTWTTERPAYSGGFVRLFSTLDEATEAAFLFRDTDMAWHATVIEA